MSGPRHFVNLHQVGRPGLREILDISVNMKAENPRGAAGEPLAGRSMAMIFEKPSTRTRVSFEVAMRQLGGHALMLTGSELQLGRGETIGDTARVLSRYVDAIMIRTWDEDRLFEMAEAATVPVINGLTDSSHPCQLMADVMTFEEHRGPIADRIIAWCGDGNNVARSWIHAAAMFGFELRMACPEELQPPAELLAWANGQGARITVGADPDTMVRGADCVVTDTWVSMGDKEAPSRHNLLRPYQVNDRLMRLAGPEAVFMHCLPAHRGEEVTDSVLDGPHSLVWDEAENRLHSQKGILMWCLAPEKVGR
ncbi:MAG: ornithine carbamoyltransferase [Alphaproteobacteria bacterium]|jgi:ornithine carbamoyltransferase|nr:ornithine carbamoyltransferase [Alphaproteobacteria bacterium]